MFIEPVPWFLVEQVKQFDRHFTQLTQESLYTYVVLYLLYPAIYGRRSRAAINSPLRSLGRALFCCRLCIRGLVSSSSSD